MISVPSLILDPFFTFHALAHPSDHHFCPLIYIVIDPRSSGIPRLPVLRRNILRSDGIFVHRITNAIAEGLNSKIATVQKMTYRYRNREHFMTAIYFHCGNLQLYPEIHTNV
jgi:hypothetical protein